MPLNPFVRISAALLIVFVACGGLVQPDGLSASATNGAIVQAGSGVVQSPGKPVVLPVTVANVQKLGATTVLVSYDPASVTVASCQRNTAFDVGLCNAAYDRNADGTADAVLFNLVSLQGVSAGETPVVLVNVAWQAAADVQPPAYSVSGCAGADLHRCRRQPTHGHRARRPHHHRGRAYACAGALHVSAPDTALGFRWAWPPRRPS